MRASVLAGMTMSLDGFVADSDGSAGRLHPDLAALRGTPSVNIDRTRVQLERIAVQEVGQRISLRFRVDKGGHDTP